MKKKGNPGLEFHQMLLIDDKEDNVDQNDRIVRINDTEHRIGPFHTRWCRPMYFKPADVYGLNPGKTKSEKKYLPHFLIKEERSMHSLFFSF